jgi:hypothetical protein
MTNRELTSKSYTVCGVDGHTFLTLSETAERDAIVVSIQKNGVKGCLATVRIDAAAFAALCAMDSAYDGLEIGKRQLPTGVGTSEETGTRA